MGWAAPGEEAPTQVAFLVLPGNVCGEVKTPVAAQWDCSHKNLHKVSLLKERAAVETGVPGGASPRPSVVWDVLCTGLLPLLLGPSGFPAAVNGKPPSA